MPEKNTKKVSAEHNEAENFTEQMEKKVSEVEKKAEQFEWKADKEVEKLVWKLWFVDKIINASWIKEILNLSFMEKANHRVRKNLEKICKILWRIGFDISIICTIWAVVAFFIALIALFKGSVWAFLLGLLFLVLAAFAVIVSRWCIKMRKWFPAIAIVSIALEIVRLVVSIFTWGFGSSLLSLILWVICTLFVLKNKDRFKN